MKSRRNRLGMLVLFTVYCLVFLLLVTYSSLTMRQARADTYKWVDEQGRTNYSETPPAGVRYSVIPPPPPADPTVLREQMIRQKQFAEKYEKQRTAADEEKKLLEEDRQARQQNCKLGRERLASYERPGVMLVQPDGSRIRATEEQRQEQIKQSKAIIDEFCPKQ